MVLGDIIQLLMEVRLMLSFLEEVGEGEIFLLLLVARYSVECTRKGNT